MKRIKVIVLVLMMTLISVLCGSCKINDQVDELFQFLNERVEQVGEGIEILIRDSHKSEDQANELVRCLNERDEEGIMNLFCEETRLSDSYDFEQQISDVFDLLGNRTIDSFDWRGGVTETSYRKGEKTWERMNVVIEKMELSDGSNDIKKIIFLTTLVDTEYPNQVGLSSIWVVIDDEEEYWIGESG